MPIGRCPPSSFSSQTRSTGGAWERPLRRADLEYLGDAAPDGPILGARVEHEIAKRALIESDPDVYFTTPHFDGYPAILARLDAAAVGERWTARPGCSVSASSRSR